jgi:hypothetical protein
MPDAPAKQRAETDLQRLRPARLLAALVVLVGVALAALAPAAQAADRFDRAFHWSGYRWVVRSNPKPAAPEHNRWSDSRANVRVRGDKTLRLDIFAGRSAEVVGPPTGYGRYRWVVKTNLSTIDPFRVAAFFVDGLDGEQDVEFSRWGHPELTAPGSWVTWRKRTRLGFGPFGVSAAAPYTIDIDWRPGTTRFAVRDASGATLVNTTHPSSRPGRHTAPRMSYWVYPGRGTNLSTFTSATVHPPIIVQSFSYRRLRR